MKMYIKNPPFVRKQTADSYILNLPELMIRLLGSKHLDMRIRFRLRTEIFQLSNAFGQVIYAGKEIEMQDFSHLPQGIYFLKIIDKQIKVVSLMKMRF